MKKVLVLFGLLLLVVSSYSQETFKFRTIAVAASNFNTATDEYDEWTDWMETNLLIFYNIKDGIITIDNKFNDKFYVRNAPEAKTTKDKQGREVIEFRMKAYDQNEKPVYIKIRTWSDDNSVQFYIYYTNLRYVYDAKQINVESNSNQNVISI